MEHILILNVRSRNKCSIINSKSYKTNYTKNSFISLCMYARNLIQVSTLPLIITIISVVRMCRYFYIFFYLAGWTGALNYYRNAMIPSTKGKGNVVMPSLVIWGTDDVVLYVYYVCVCVCVCVCVHL